MNPEHTYCSGQVWHYRTRPGEEQSLLHIVRTETHAGKTIFHIALSGLNMRNPHTETGRQTELPHLPVSEHNLHQSLIEPSSAARSIPSDFAEAYACWKTAFGAGEAGVFDLSPAEIVAYVEETIN